MGVSTNLELVFVSTDSFPRTTKLVNIKVHKYINSINGKYRDKSSDQIKTKPSTLTSDNDIANIF